MEARGEREGGQKEGSKKKLGCLIFFTVFEIKADILVLATIPE